MKSYNLVHFIISVLYISICLNWFRICQALTWLISIIQFIIVVVVDLSKKKKTSSSTVIMDKIWEMSEMYFLKLEQKSTLNIKGKIRSVADI